MFVEGTPERFEIAKRLIEEIVSEAKRLNKIQSTSTPATNVAINADVNPFPGPHIPYPIPNQCTGLVIGKNGDTLKSIQARSGAYLYIPKSTDLTSGERILELSGSEDQIERAKREIQKLLHNSSLAKCQLSSSTSESTYTSENLT